MVDYSVLEEKSLVIIFATSPTGLGHLRVTDALYHGLPDTVSHVLLGAQDPSISTFYRLVSIHPFTRAIMEGLQNGHLEQAFTFVSRHYLRSHTKLLYQQLKTILGERLVVPKTILLVATHTALAHQLGELKEKLQKETGVNIILVVQVTDDSPQMIWYVEEADMIFVPSEYTKDHLLQYAKKQKLPLVPITVSAYPISPLLTEDLHESAFEKRSEQTKPDPEKSIHVCIPVSGAAIGTSYITELMHALHKASTNYVFHVVSKEAPYTKRFLSQMKDISYVKLSISNHDRTTVSNYEQVYIHNIVAFEITKPSEQAFKALATPTQKGGAILLFSQPVGRQEYDNLHFLRNHGMLPSKRIHSQLWQLAEEQKNAPPEILSEAHSWRGLRLPDTPSAAAQFIYWCQTQGIFMKMMKYKRQIEKEETSSNGVEQFWSTVANLIKATSI